MDGSGHDLIWDAIPAFPWRYWIKLLKVYQACLCTSRNSIMAPPKHKLESWHIEPTCSESSWDNVVKQHIIPMSYHVTFNEVCLRRDISNSAVCFHSILQAEAHCRACVKRQACCWEIVEALRGVTLSPTRSITAPNRSRKQVMECDSSVLQDEELIILKTPVDFHKGILGQST